MTSNNQNQPNSALSTVPRSILGCSVDLKVTTRREGNYTKCTIDYPMPKVKLLGDKLYVWPQSNNEIAHSEQITND